MTSDSIIPGKRAVYVHLNWKTLIMILAIIGGGSGGLTAFQFVTEKDVDERIDKHTEKNEETTQQLQTLIEQNSQANARQDQVLGEVTFRLDAFQTVQNKSFARDEARRLTDEIQDRKDRERTYDRLVDINETRLSKGKDPCRDVRCSQ